VTKLSINFEEILSRAHGKFDELNMVLETSTIIINYCFIFIIVIIIINAYGNV